MLSSIARAGCIAVAAAAIATPAAADVVVFEGSGHASWNILTNLPLTAGVFDLYIETSEFVNFTVAAQAFTELAIRPVGPPSPLVDYGSGGYQQGGTASGYSAFFQFEMPQNSYSQFVAGSQYLLYGIAPGTLMSSEFRYDGKRLSIMGQTNGGPPYEYDYTVKLVQRTAVPEPAAWALMILGFGGLGSAMRRRRLAAIPG